MVASFPPRACRQLPSTASKYRSARMERLLNSILVRNPQIATKSSSPYSGSSPSSNGITRILPGIESGADSLARSWLLVLGYGFPSFPSMAARDLLTETVWGRVRPARVTSSLFSKKPSGFPEYTSLPSLRTCMSSAHEYARSTSCVDITTVVPPRYSWSTSSIISLDICGSSPAVGSSRIRILGSIARAPAIATLLRCPNDSWVVGLFLYSSIPTLNRLSRMRRSTISGGRLRFIGPNATSSSTVDENICSSGFWTTTEMYPLSSYRWSFL